MLAVLWVVSSTVGGAVLAALARHLNPALSFRRMWVFYSGLLALFVAVVFGVVYR